MKIIAVVAARGGSKSIPRKNLKKLSGKSLINYILGTLLNIKEIDRTILSSDSKEILRVAQKNNKKTLEIRLRPENLSRDETPLTSVAHHVANELFKENTFLRFRKEFFISEKKIKTTPDRCQPGDLE